MSAGPDPSGADASEPLDAFTAAAFEGIDLHAPAPAPISLEGLEAVLREALANKRRIICSPDRAEQIRGVLAASWELGCAFEVVESPHLDSGMAIVACSEREMSERLEAAMLADLQAGHPGGQGG